MSPPIAPWEGSITGTKTLGSPNHLLERFQVERHSACHVIQKKITQIVLSLLVGVPTITLCTLIGHTVANLFEREKGGPYHIWLSAMGLISGIIPGLSLAAKTYTRVGNWDCFKEKPLRTSLMSDDS